MPERLADIEPLRVSVSLTYRVMPESPDSVLVESTVSEVYCLKLDVPRSVSALIVTAPS